MNPSPALFYDFREVSSTIVPDVTGNGHAGVIRGDAYGSAHMTEAEVFGSVRPILSLTEGEKPGYLQLPEGAADNTEGITVSCIARVHKSPEPGCLFSFGRDACFCLLTYADEEKPDEFLLYPSFTVAGRSQEASCFDTQIRIKKGQWFHLSFSLSAGIPGQALIAVDGRIIARFSHRRAASLSLNHAVFCCLGYGAFADGSLAADYAEAAVFDRALGEGELSSLFRVDSAHRFGLEKAALPPIPETLDSPLALPLAGQYGCTLAWSVDGAPCAHIEEGHILCPVRPAHGQPDGLASLHLSLCYGGEELALSFPLRVPALPSDEELAAEDLVAVRLPHPGHVISSLSLPARGENGSAISWESSDVQYISPTGEVHRDICAHDVTLTATASLREARASRQFALRLLPEGGRENGRAANGIRILLPDRPYAPTRKGQAAAASRTVLTDHGLLKENESRCLDYLLLLDADRMLYNFRRAYGTDTKGAKPLGGWEEPAGLLRGHSTGHLLSALAHAYASAGDARLLEKARYMVHELRGLQLLCHGDPAAFATACSPQSAPQSAWDTDPSGWGEGFLSAYSPDQFALLEQFTPYATIWAPYYTLHKLMAGMLDVYRLCRLEEALDAAKGMADWVCGRLAATNAAQREAMWAMYIAGEYGGINESLAALTSITGEERYRHTAALFDNPKLFDGLAEGKDTISGLHANQHIPQVIGALAAFDAGADERYYRIARHFWQIAVNHYTYSIGGVGRGEIFREPDVLAGNIEGERNCETCAAYNMLKLTAGLYRHEPAESGYMDYYERALLNQIAASQTPAVTANRHNGVTYMLPIGPGARREYSSDYQDFTCCHGTGMENHVKYNENIFYREGDTLYVNLYIGAEYREAGEDAPLLALDAGFPGEESTLRFLQGFTGTIALRIPDWCREGFAAAMRGQAYRGEGGYLLLKGPFAAGEEIQIHTPFTLHLCAAPDHPNGLDAVSVMYGPIVMVALSGQIDWLTLQLAEPLSEQFRVETEGAYPKLYYEDLEFVPMYAAHGVRYHTYFRVKYR